MPKKISPMERKDIIQRLRLHHPIRRINRETGYSREVIRTIKNISEKNGWLTTSKQPSEKEIAVIFNKPQEKEHPRDQIKEKIEDWVKKGYTYVVITNLIQQYSINYNEITIRRYIKRHFPKIKRPVIRRTFFPGETAEVDFGYLGVMYHELSKRNRKVWIFSMRLNYSIYKT
ncbi:MAG: hypothetical protein MJB14_22915 [Spirochaetes bacterium]|nr:hypothetical protein [Spirochaetota bacterium]